MIIVYFYVLIRLRMQAVTKLWTAPVVSSVRTFNFLSLHLS